MQLPKIIRKILQATRLWREHGLILQELKYFRRFLALALLWSSLSAVMAALSIGLIGALLQGLTSPQAPPLQTGITWIDIDVLGIQTSASQRVYRLAGLTLAATWLQIAGTYWGKLYFRYTALGLVNRLRKKLFEQLQSLSLSYYLTASTGSLTNTLSSEVPQIQQALLAISRMVTQLFLFLGYCVSMVALSWQLSLAMLGIISSLSWGLQGFQRRVRKASVAVPQANQHFTAITLELIHGIRTIHACNSQDFERQRYYQAADHIQMVARRMVRDVLRVQPISHGVASTLLIVLITSAYTLLIEGGALRASTLLAFLFVVSRSLPLVTQLSDSGVTLLSLYGSLQSVSELLDTDHKPYLQDGVMPYPGLYQAIELVNVSFGYESDQLVLEDINLSIQKGQVTALVGASGAGKTTLADLLPRFFTPTAGQILVDGVDLQQLQIQTLRDQMAIVSQDTYIFNASVRDNIAYGLTQVADAAIEEAAAQANGLEFILEMPAGFATQLGDRGIRLSGGQRQRIAIARALLRNPEILILDEATSALDSITEQLIQESLMTLVAGRTVIAIAHRLSTIANADQVVVLEQGRIVEQGTYQALLNQKGQLWQYHQRQYQQPAQA